MGTLGASRLFDAHGMQPDVVLGVLDMLGGAGVAGAAGPGLARILVVGCEPASVDYGMELSEPVAKAVDEAVREAGSSAPGHRNGAWGCVVPEARRLALSGVRPGACRDRMSSSPSPRRAPATTTPRSSAKGSTQPSL